MRLALLIPLLFVACGDDAVQSDATRFDAIDTALDTAPDTSIDTREAVLPEAEVEVTPEIEVEVTPEVEVEIEVAPTCVDLPNPFVGPTEPEPWNNTGSSATTVLGGPNHRGQDVIVQVGNPQVLVAKFGYAFVDKDMTCEDVDIWIQREVPCGAWEYIGEARTTDNPDDSLECNNFGTQYGIEDDGGRVFFEIPDNKAFGVGRYPVRMVLKGDLSEAKFDLVVVNPGTQAIITDVDGTLTTSDNELITEVALSIFNETYEQEMYVDADTMIRGWSDKGYLIIYMSGRPDVLRRMSERWLEERFVPGPIHLTDTNAQVMPNNDGVGIYKKEFIAYLRAQGIDLVAAYGNATTDIWAYEQAGMPKNVTWIIGKHAGEEGTTPLTGSYTSHLPTAAAFPEATIKAPPVLYGWW